MQPDTSTRLRLVEVRTPGGTLRLGGGFACVLAAPAARSAAARWIATSVVGPRPSGADGTIEIAGRFVSVRSLPSPLLAPSEACVLGREVLRAHWQAAWVARRDELGAAHASRRLARHRTEAALDRIRRRAGDLAARMDALPPAVASEDAAAREAEVQRQRTEAARRAVHESAVGRAADARERRARIATLVTELSTFAPVPSRRAQALADEWVALVASSNAAAAARAPVPADAEVESAEAKVSAARIALAQASGGIDPEARAQLDRLHRAVIDAEADVSEARRKERAQALARYESAVRAEHDALGAAGVASYASLLVTIAQGARLPDPAARARAAAELAAAETEADRAREAQRVRQLGARATEDELDLRARAAELLGRFPDEDVVDDLRALRVEHPEVAPTREQLRAELLDLGVPVAGDPEVAARQFLASAPPAEPEPDAVSAPAPAAAIDAQHAPPSGPPEARQALTEEHAALHDEVLALVRTRDEHAGILDQLDAELARFEIQRTADLSALSPDDILLAVTALLDAYRRGDVLAGRLPLVLDGALDGLPEPTRRAAIAAFSAATDVQAVLVTDDPHLVDAVRDAKGVTLTWPEPAAASPVEPTAAASASWEDPQPRPSQDVPRPLAAAPPMRPGSAPERCAAHVDAASVVRCAHCSRPCCLECLVYVIGEPDLWCATCAVATHSARPKHLRVLRRRGA